MTVESERKRDETPVTCSPFLSRCKVRNYKSIAKCDITFKALTALVGRNGSGKSNFLDSLRFVVDGLRTSLDHAIKSRGGIKEVRRRSTGHPHNFAIELEITLDHRFAKYGFEIAAQKSGGFIVKHERLTILTGSNEQVARYRVEHTENNMVVSGSHDPMPPAASDRLYLVTAAVLPEFRPVYDSLSSMGFYNLNPQVMKKPQSPDAGELLDRDGRNIASVVARLISGKPAVKERLSSYLSKIVPGTAEVERVKLGLRETLLFRQVVAGSKHPRKFYGVSVSDGTLRALGILVAVSQLAVRKDHVKLIGIEEPEIALHPAASGALIDALREATSHTQVLFTTHSPDLLDAINPENEALLAVQSIQGNTTIAPVDAASQEAIRNQLYTAGDLLRMDQLEPNKADVDRQEQMQIFEDAEDTS